jgi:enterochelin esterase-like enzyme
MSLTGLPLLALMTALALGSVAGAAWLWPRLSRPWPAQLAERLGLILLTQIFATAAVLTFLNDYLSLMGSWSEVFGTGPQRHAWTASPPPQFLASPVAITGATLGVSFGRGTLAPQAAQRLLASPPTGTAVAAAARNGVVLRVTIHGQYTGITTGSDYVYLPPQYFMPGHAAERFPVVLGFTGYPNEPLDLMRLLYMPSTAARLVKAGRAQPAIYVMVNPSVALPRDTECTNVPAGPQVATFFGRDLPLALEHTFRVNPGRSGWGAIGYSTGAYCAVKLAMLYPDQFSAAVGLSGYYVALKDLTTGNIYGGSPGYRAENDLGWRLSHLPAPPISVLVASTASGEQTLPGTMTFLHLIRPPMRGYSLILRQGGHNYFTWRRELPQSLTWLSARLRPTIASAGHLAGLHG